MDTLKRIEQFTKDISAFTELINHILTTEKQIDEPHDFIRSLSFKTNNSLFSANQFIGNLLITPHITDSLFLILRTVMSDAISFYYILYKSNNDDNLLVENIRWLYSQHIYYMLNGLDIFQAGYKEDNATIEQMKQEMKSKYHAYFNEDGTHKYPRMKPVSSMVKEIANSNKYLNSPAIRAYGLYDIFSKYEHLGILTTHLIHRQFDEKNRRQILGEVYESVREIVTFQRSLLSGTFDLQQESEFERLCSQIECNKIYE